MLENHDQCWLYVPSVMMLGLVEFLAPEQPSADGIILKRNDRLPQQLRFDSAAARRVDSS